MDICCGHLRRLEVRLAACVARVSVSGTSLCWVASVVPVRRLEPNWRADACLVTPSCCMGMLPGCKVVTGAKLEATVSSGVKKTTNLKALVTYVGVCVCVAT
jgi:hypothetical protein